MKNKDVVPTGYVAPEAMENMNLLSFLVLRDELNCFLHLIYDLELKGFWFAKKLQEPANLHFLSCTFIKQLLLDEVFVISRIIKIKMHVGVISQSQKLRLVTLTEKKWELCCCFFPDGKQHKAGKLGMIALRNHALQSFMTR